MGGGGTTFWWISSVSGINTQTFLLVWQNLKMSIDDHRELEFYENLEFLCAVSSASFGATVCPALLSSLGGWSLWSFLSSGFCLDLTSRRRPHHLFYTLETGPLTTTLTQASILGAGEY